jgi:hypothetical protein
MSGNKLSFSLKTTKKKSTNAAAATPGFDADPEPLNDHEINDDLPKEPLVIPVQEDARQSLQEQARSRRQQEQNETTSGSSKEEQAAIEALNAQAGRSADDSAAEKASKMVIEGAQNTFQRGATTAVEEADSDAKQLQQDLERLAPEVSVDSQVYRQVPITDFGAAMLRGMGWTGQVDKSDQDTNLPRPSRLGLGATPKLLDAPTHGRRPRRQDQVKREERLNQQQEEFEKQKLQQLKLDKQRTIQEGSIVRVHSFSSSTRAIIRKWQGVPGLNMTLVHFEGDNDPVKVKKGDVKLVERQELQEKPFEAPKYETKEMVEYLGEAKEKRDKSKERDQRRDLDRDRDRNRSRQQDDDYDKRRSSDDRADGDDDSRRRREKKDDREDRRDKKRRHDRDHGDDRKRHRQEENASQHSTWLTPHIRVRVVSSKAGREYYKEKGVVVDVTRKGTATLNMSNGQVIQVPERYLETALPKVGGNACILTGNHRLAKGRLLERDSRKNRGAVQIFEDMNIVTTSLDDMAEWCGPLDDDLME